MRELINDSWVETELTERVIEPMAVWVPAYVLPNHITAINSVCVWTAFFLATRVPLSAGVSALALRLLVAVLITASLILDCLDGVLARSRNQTSDLGEVLDHGLDALNIQLITATLLLSVGGAPAALFAASQGITALIYNAQVVLYRLEHTMIQPPTNGVEAECVLILAHVVLAGVLHLAEVPSWVRVTGLGAALGVCALDYRFFSRILARHAGSPAARLHPQFAGTLVPPVLLHLLGVTTTTGCVLVFAVVALYCTGAVVLHTVADKRQGGALTPGLDRVYTRVVLAELLVLVSAVTRPVEETRVHVVALTLLVLVLAANDFLRLAPVLSRVKTQ